MFEKTVLIADDDADLVAALAGHIEQLGVTVETVTNGLDALVRALTSPPDLLILDVNMPALDGLTVCEQLVASDRAAPFPVIVLSVDTESKTIRRCVKTGAHYCPKHVDLWRRLNPLVCKHLNLGAAPVDDLEDVLPDGQAPRILVVDDDLELADMIAHKLSQYGVDVIQAENGTQGYWMALMTKPDLIVTDLNMPEMSGEVLIRKLIYAPATQDIPIFVLTGLTVNGETDFALKRELLSRGNTLEYLSKPVQLDGLIEKLRLHLKLPPVSTEAIPPMQMAAA